MKERADEHHEATSSTVSPERKASTSARRYRRCPPGVLKCGSFPSSAHRATVSTETLKSVATSPLVSGRSVLPVVVTDSRPYRERGNESMTRFRMVLVDYVDNPVQSRL